MAAVSLMDDSHNAGMGSLIFIGNLTGIVFAAIIDDDDLDVLAAL
jgi:hypothetical protein